MKNSWRVACVAGVGINVHWSFSLLVLWLIWHGAFGQRELKSVLFLAAAILLLFGCVLLHELGHALTAVQLKVMVKDIVILPIGGLAQIEAVPERPLHDLLIATAGPLMNLAVAFGAVLVLILGGETRFLVDFWASPEVTTATLLQSPFQQGILTSFSLFLLVANLILFVFNLIPAIPMDGGRILRALLTFFMPYTEAARITRGIGQAITILLIFWAIRSNRLSLLFIAAFVFLTTLSMSSKPGVGSRK